LLWTCYAVIVKEMKIRFETTMDNREQITTVGDGLLLLAPAKINLSLLIAGKRPDGFHEIETIMAKIDWYDEILIQPGRQAGIELICNGPHWAPAGEDNLVTKNIPAGTGLGSASSDAAATLIGINHYFKLGLDQKNLIESATKLGSDVAFFLGGPLAFCTGKGEKVKKLDDIFNFTALLILPDVSVSTKMVYGIYQHNQHLYKKLNIRIKNR